MEEEALDVPDEKDDTWEVPGKEGKSVEVAGIDNVPSTAIEEVHLNSAGTEEKLIDVPVENPTTDEEQLLALAESETEEEALVEVPVENPTANEEQVLELVKTEEQVLELVETEEQVLEVVETEEQVLELVETEEQVLELVETEEKVLELVETEEEEQVEAPVENPTADEEQVLELAETAEEGQVDVPIENPTADEEDVLESAESEEEGLIDVPVETPMTYEEESFDLDEIEDGLLNVPSETPVANKAKSFDEPETEDKSADVISTENTTANKEEPLDDIMPDDESPAENEGEDIFDSEDKVVNITVVENTGEYDERHLEIDDSEEQLVEVSVEVPGAEVPTGEPVESPFASDMYNRIDAFLDKSEEPESSKNEAPAALNHFLFLTGPRGREADYDVNPTELYQLIEDQEWVTAAQRAEYNPREAKIFIYRRDRRDPTKYKWRMLPLHAAILMSAPISVIKALLTAFPKATQYPDDTGDYPIHLAVKKHVGEQILNLLLQAYPDSIEERNADGKTALEIAKVTRSHNRAYYLEALKRGTLHARITRDVVSEMFGGFKLPEMPKIFPDEEKLEMYQTQIEDKLLEINQRNNESVARATKYVSDSLEELKKVDLSLDMANVVGDAMLAFGYVPTKAAQLRGTAENGEVEVTLSDNESI